MSYQILQEVTVWSKPGVPNHIYLVEGYEKLVGYAPEGTNKPIIFDKPMMFNRAGREFKYLNREAITPPNSRLVKSSSSSAVYEVDDDKNTCTCPGFMYRGRCKHLKKA